MRNAVENSVWTLDSPYDNEGDDVDNAEFQHRQEEMADDLRKEARKRDAANLEDLANILDALMLAPMETTWARELEDAVDKRLTEVSQWIREHIKRHDEWIREYIK